MNPPTNTSSATLPTKTPSPSRAANLLGAVAAIAYETCIRLMIAVAALTAGVAAGTVSTLLGVWS